MKQTEHYGLSQWEPTDRILMEDFNADNLKIAAALAGKMGQLEKWYTFGGSDDGFIAMTFMILPYKSTWSDWAFTVAQFETKDLEQAKQDTMELRLNGELVSTIPGGPFLVITAPLHDPTRNVQGLLLANNMIKFFHLNLPFEGITDMALSNGSHTNTHSNSIYGIR